jgi:ubiquinone/menaquinone biosynthesis C-methylase UbiE
VAVGLGVLRFSSHPTPQDLGLLRRTLDADAALASQDRLTSDDADAYYARTTDVDYRALELCVGPGMHTELCAPPPILRYGGHTRQAVFVLAEVSAVTERTNRQWAELSDRKADARANVLEVGFGRGYCLMFLAGLMPHVHFHGVDRVQRHLQLAGNACLKGGYSNVELFVGDGTEFLCSMSDTVYDVVFGVEALCHLDTAAKLRAFVESVTKRLTFPGGRLVIVDGFRSAGFDDAPEDHRTAMRLAERGFQIRRMPSKAEWVQEAKEAGLQLVRSVDLTSEALPFWTMGWRVARSVLRLVPCVRALGVGADNLLSVAMTAHALREAAEYGVLVFERGGVCE